MYDDERFCNNACGGYHNRVSPCIINLMRGCHISKVCTLNKNLVHILVDTIQTVYIYTASITLPRSSKCDFCMIGKDWSM